MTPRASHPRAISPRRQYAIVAAVSFLGLACSVITMLMLRSWERERVAKDFDRAAGDRIASLKGDLGLHNLITSALQAYFLTDEEVDPTEFRNFASPLLRQEPSIQAMAWVPRVRGSDRAAFEANARASIRSDFELRERSGHGFQICPERSEYFPVLYVEPFRENDPALGFDMASDPARREAMQRACDTALPAATAPVVLVQGGEIGYVLLMPVYRRDPGPAATATERRAALKGFAFGVFRASSTLEDAMSDLAPADIDVYAFDSTDPSQAKFLCFHSSRTRTKLLPMEEVLHADPPGAKRRSETLEVAGRRWTVVCTPTPDFAASRTTLLPWAALAGGLMLTALLAMYLRNTARHVSRVGRLMDQAVAANQSLTAEMAERRRAEEALRESQERFSQVAETAGELIWEIDPEGLLTYCNPAFEAALGYQVEEIVGKMHFFDFFAPDVKHEQVRQVSAFLSARQPIRGLVTKNLHRSGNAVYHETTGVPVLDSRGNLVAYRGVNVDVTKRRQDQEALHESREFLAKIINCIRDPIFVMDEEDRFVLVNEAMRAIHGRPREDILGKTTQDLLPAELADGYLRINREVLATGQDNVLEELTINAQGRHLNLLTTKTRHVGPDGRRYVVGILRDVTESKKAEEALRGSREFLNKIINTVRDPLFAEDEEHRFVLANDALCAFDGEPREGILGRTVRDLFRPEDAEAVWNVDEQVLLTGQDNVTEERITIASRPPAVLLTKKSLYVDPDGRRFVVGVVRDITEAKRAEEALRESEEKYRNVVDNIGLGVAMVGPGMELLALNAQMRRWFPAISLADRPLCYRAFNNPPREGPCSYCPTRLTLADGLVHEAVTDTPAGGEVRNFRIVSSAIRDTAGKVIAAVEMVEDITDRKHLEDELRQSHDLLEQRVRDRTTELVAANQQLRRAQTDLVQGEKMSMLGLLAAGVAHEINTPTGAILNVVADSYGHLKGVIGLSAAFTELPPATRDWMRQLLSGVLGGAATRSEPAVRAERRRVEALLRQGGLESPRRIAEVIVACGLADRVDPGILEHLAQEPVLGMLEHILAMKSATDITHSSATKIARIVRALRNYSRDEAAASGRLNVNESIDNTLVILQHRLKHIPEVAVHLAEGLPPAVCGPELAQVWTNLLNNACDAVELSGPQRPARVEVSTRLEGGRVIAAFSNSGPPIPEEVMQKMYDPFFTTKPVGKGTGLGLSICASILERCGAGISARNEDGRVIFEVSIPAGEAYEAPATHGSPAPAVAVGQASEGGADS